MLVVSNFSFLVDNIRADGAKGWVTIILTECNKQIHFHFHLASMLIAHHADRAGYYAFHALIGPIWSLVGFLVLELLKDNAGAWNFYVAALFLASSPSWHGMHIAWMSSNLAPIGKRTLALGAIVGAANIAGIPGSQIYRKFWAYCIKKKVTSCLI